MQFFKGDETERKYYDCGRQIFEQMSGQKDAFFNGAYGCFVLGELLYDNNYAPLANAIPRAIFRESFENIFDSFLLAGTFESYLTVFRNVFGNDVEVTFTVPAPGKLEIDIVAQGLQLYEFSARGVVDNNYVYDTIIDDEGDTICFQGFKGLESQYEIEQMLFEMVPDGIFTTITLEVGT